MSGPLTKRRLYNLNENERRLVIPPDLAHPVSLLSLNQLLLPSYLPGLLLDPKLPEEIQTTNKPRRGHGASR